MCGQAAEAEGPLRPRTATDAAAQAQVEKAPLPRGFVCIGQTGA